MENGRAGAIKRRGEKPREGGKEETFACEKPTPRREIRAEGGKHGVGWRPTPCPPLRNHRYPSINRF